MDYKNIDLLKKNLICIECSKEKYDTKEFDTSDFTIDKIIHKYSNTGIPIYRFFYKDEIITKNNHFLLKYKCLTCEAIHKVALNNILRKINRNITRCRICKELDEYKRNQQSKYMLNCNGKPKKSNNIKDVITLENKLIMDKKAFEEYDDDFKDNYFRRNMTNEEFDYIKNKIKFIQNKKFEMDNDFIYYPIVSISNQSRFCPYLYSQSRNCLEKIHNITLLCDNCDTEFLSKDLHSHKNKIKSLCKDCNLTNNIFKLRSYENLSKEKIMYQSKFELKFIRYCNEKKIYLINGPKIDYTFKDKNCKYKIDFAIPKLNLLIEIKDNHIWHREQINNGKWNSKIKGVNQYLDSEKNIYKNFIVIFPKNYIKELDKIVKKYWKNSL
tara:strand:- start:10669 stop:11817 length:1149 start_codon:yes stop_codon:yes gene_type:complete